MSVIDKKEDESKATLIFTIETPQEEIFTVSSRLV